MVTIPSNTPRALTKPVDLEVGAEAPIQRAAT
jgi:hypothetical protein